MLLLVISGGVAQAEMAPQWVPGDLQLRCQAQQCEMVVVGGGFVTPDVSIGAGEVRLRATTNNDPAIMVQIIKGWKWRRSCRRLVRVDR